MVLGGSRGGVLAAVVRVGVLFRMRPRDVRQPVAEEGHVGVEDLHEPVDDGVDVHHRDVEGGGYQHYGVLDGVPEGEAVPVGVAADHVAGGPDERGEQHPEVLGRRGLVAVVGGDLPEPLLEDVVVHLHGLPSAVDLVDQVGHVPGAVGHVELQRAGEGCGDEDVLLLLQELGGAPEDLLGGLLDDVYEYLVLALEAVVQAPVEDPRLRYYVPGGGLLVSVGEEQLE